MFANLRSARALGVLAAAAFGAMASTAQAYEVVSRFGQPEQMGAGGRLAVEASFISVINCQGAGERGGQFWIYQYINRPGYRAILPPHWSNALGGKDWSTFGEAAHVACTGAMPAKAPVRIDDLLAGHGDDDGHAPIAATPTPRAGKTKGLRPVGSPSRGVTQTPAQAGGEDHHH
jgi:hypothetical protein